MMDLPPAPLPCDAPRQTDYARNPPGATHSDGGWSALFVRRNTMEAVIDKTNSKIHLINQ